MSLRRGFLLADPLSLSLNETLACVGVEEAADILGIEVESTRRLLRKGTLRGHKVGQKWYVDRYYLESFKAVYVPRRGKGMRDDEAREFPLLDEVCAYCGTSNTATRPLTIHDEAGAWWHLSCATHALAGLSGGPSRKQDLPKSAAGRVYRL